MAGINKRKCCCSGPCGGCQSTFTASACKVRMVISGVTSACTLGQQFTPSTMSGTYDVTALVACQWTSVDGGFPYTMNHYTTADCSGASDFSLGVTVKIEIVASTDSPTGWFVYATITCGLPVRAFAGRTPFTAGDCTGTYVVSNGTDPAISSGNYMTTSGTVTVTFCP